MHFRVGYKSPVTFKRKLFVATVSSLYPIS